MSARSLRHVGIVVTDADRALRFYRDQLGLRVEVDQVEEGEFIDSILAAPKTSVRTVKLSATEGETLVELLEFAGGGSPVALEDVARLGPTHVALTVRELDALHTRLSAAGVRFLSAPKIAPDGRARVAFCADPDGALLELVEPLGAPG
ncbi:MAG: hypothetical protein E6G56_09800 [Actinobacteria bacterium]|nr:MAG: hypothetical protein E6G56_09800 [Actinomycetota bacterium]